MIRVLSGNIISPLGATLEQNYLALREGHSALRRYNNWHNVPYPFAASFIPDELISQIAVSGFTRFESLAVRSIADALAQTDIDVTSQRTFLIISTTKDNVRELGASSAEDGDYCPPGPSAQKIAGYFGMTTEPLIVCNACISGVTAQLLACRLMETGHCDHVIVCGIDCSSLFEVAIFLSFKSLSPNECRPFDIERQGLNLGEAASTIILGKCSDAEKAAGQWKIVNGYLNNDAYHISAPCPNGDGMVQAISKTIQEWDRESLATVSAHGTATLFNDQMESKAIERCSLSTIPISALKGYYGHTFGAAGVIETALTMRGLDDGYIFPVRGFEEIGVSGKISISNRPIHTDRDSFLKIISGFGGNNGAMLLSKSSYTANAWQAREVRPIVTHTVHLTDSSLSIDGRNISLAHSGKALLTEIYKTMLDDYPRFYKMDVFNRMVYTATALLINAEGPGENDGNRAIVFFNRTSSVVSDRKHIATYTKGDGFFPSPGIAVYTLPNIVSGEVAIKYGYKGETSFYILATRNDSLMNMITDVTFAMSDIRSMITGWVDCSSEDTFEADIRILTI